MHRPFGFLTVAATAGAAGALTAGAYADIIGFQDGILPDSSYPGLFIYAGWVKVA